MQMRDSKKGRKWTHKESSDTLPKIVRQATISLAYKTVCMRCAICQGEGGACADVICAGVTDYYKQEFLKGVEQGGAGGSGRPLQTKRYPDTNKNRQFAVNVKPFILSSFSSLLHFTSFSSMFFSTSLFSSSHLPHSSHSTLSPLLHQLHFMAYEIFLFRSSLYFILLLLTLFHLLSFSLLPYSSPPFSHSTLPPPLPSPFCLLLFLSSFLLTPWYRISFEKLIVTQLVKQ